MRARSPWLPALIRLLGTGAAGAWVVHHIQWKAVLASFSRFESWVIAVPLAVVFLNTLNHAVRVSWVLRHLGEHIRVAVVLSALMRGAFLGLSLPTGGGEVAKAALLGRSGPGLARSVSALVLVRFTQLPSWIVVLTWGLCAGLYRGAPLLLGAAAVFVVMAVSLLVIVATGAIPWPRRWPLAGRVDRWRSDFAAIRTARGLMARLALLGLAAAVVNALGVWGILHAAQTPLPLTTLLGVVPAADVLIWLPISFSGIGVRESTFALALGIWGVPAPLAVAVGIVRWSGELTRAAIGCMIMALGTGRTQRNGPLSPRKGAQDE